MVYGWLLVVGLEGWFADGEILPSTGVVYEREDVIAVFVFCVKCVGYFVFGW